MSRRLQVVVADTDLERYAHTANAAGLTLSEWARQALRQAERAQSSGDVEAKLAAIRGAASHRAGGHEVDVDTMIAETEAGRLAEIEAGMGGTGDA
jgi:hypothetical protein